MTFVRATYVLASFVHISNISAVTDQILTKFCGSNFSGALNSRSREGQGKVKVKSKQNKGKVKVMSRQGKPKIKARAG